MWFCIKKKVKCDFVIDKTIYIFLYYNIFDLENTKINLTLT